MSKHKCPGCDAPLSFDLVLQAVPEQTMTYRIVPLAGSLLSAKSIGSQLKAIGNLLEVCAKHEGGQNIHAYVAGLSMDAENAVEINLLLAEVAPTHPEQPTPDGRANGDAQ